MPTPDPAPFDLRAEQAEERSRLWIWAIYRVGTSAPFRRSRPIFRTSDTALDAGREVLAQLRRPASRPSFVKPGL